MMCLILNHPKLHLSNVKQVHLSVDNDNYRAIHIYKKHGFIKTTDKNDIIYMYKNLSI